MLTDKWFRNFSLTQRFYKEDKYSLVGKGFTHKSLHFNVTRFEISSGVRTTQHTLILEIQGPDKPNHFPQY